MESGAGHFTKVVALGASARTGILVVLVGVGFLEVNAWVFVGSSCLQRPSFSSLKARSRPLYLELNRSLIGFKLSEAGLREPRFAAGVCLCRPEDMFAINVDNAEGTYTLPRPPSV